MPKTSATPQAPTIIPIQMTGTVEGKDELNTLYESAERHSLHADDPEAFRQGKLPVLKSYEEFQKSYLKAAENPANTTKPLIINGKMV